MALSETGWLLTFWLLHHPGWHSQAQLARMAGPTAPTVGRYVHANAPLVRYGLVERSPTGKVRAGPAPDRALLERIATEMGSSGALSALLAGIRAEYRATGLLDDDGYWLNDGNRGPQATWLVDPGPPHGEPDS